MCVFGFCVGKVLLLVIIKCVGCEVVLDEVVCDLIGFWYLVVIDVVKIVLVGELDFDIFDCLCEGELLCFLIEIGVWLKVIFGDYKGFEVGRCELEVGDEVIDVEIE